MAYVEKPARTALVKLFDEQAAPGTVCTIAQLSKIISAMRPPHKSCIGYRGQSVARVLVEHCGWVRGAHTVRKPMPDDPPMPRWFKPIPQAPYYCVDADDVI